MDLESLTPMINQVAAVTYRSYSSWVSLQDVTANLWLWAVNNRSRVEDYAANSGTDFSRIIVSILRTEARTHAIKERAVSTGYSPEDISWYSIKQIKASLPDVFDYEDWQSFQQGRSDRSASKPVNESGDRLAAILDIKAALSKMDKEKVELLKEHYGRGVSVEACAIALGINPEACRKRVERAVQAISKALNDPRPKDPMEGATYEEWKANQRFYDTRTRGRHAISNAAARKRTEGSYGE